MADDQTEATTVLWEYAKAGADQQSTEFDSLRTRAVAIISVATLVSGLFGSQLPALHHSHFKTAALVAALVCFGITVSLVVTIAWPRSWYSGAHLDELVTQVADGEASLAQINLSLASRVEENWTANQRTLSSLYPLFGLECLLVGLQVIAWSVAVF
jgi:hypothetical protein